MSRSYNHLGFKMKQQQILLMQIIQEGHHMYCPLSGQFFKLSEQIHNFFFLAIK